MIKKKKKEKRNMTLFSGCCTTRYILCTLIDLNKYAKFWFLTSKPLKDQESLHSLILAKNFSRISVEGSSNHTAAHDNLMFFPLKFKLLYETC